MNKVILVGNLTRDPECKTTQSGKNLAKFTVAVQRDYKNSDGKYDADYIYCTAWDKTAELIGNYLSKGSKVGVDGKLKNNSYEKDGVKVTTTECEVEKIEFITSAKPKDTAPKGEIFEELNSLDDEELPF